MVRKNKLLLWGFKIGSLPLKKHAILIDIAFKKNE